MNSSRIVQFFLLLGALVGGILAAKAEPAARTRTKLNSSFVGRQVYLEFEGVYRNSTLWVDGQKVGSHRSGYTGVVYDLTPYVHFDGQPNLLALRVDGRTGPTAGFGISPDHVSMLPGVRQ